MCLYTFSELCWIVNKMYMSLLWCGSDAMYAAKASGFHQIALSLFFLLELPLPVHRKTNTFRHLPLNCKHFPHCIHTPEAFPLPKFISHDL